MRQRSNSYREARNNTDLGKFFNECFERWRSEQIKRGIPSPECTQTEFARIIGVPNTAWSQYIRGNREPNPERIDELSKNEWIGPEIYNFVEVAPRLPDDPRVRYIVANWHLLEEEEQVKYLKLFRKTLGDDAADIINGLQPA